MRGRTNSTVLDTGARAASAIREASAAGPNLGPGGKRRGPRLTLAQKQHLVALLSLHGSPAIVRDVLRIQHPDFPDIDDRTIRYYWQQVRERTLAPDLLDAADHAQRLLPALGISTPASQLAELQRMYLTLEAAARDASVQERCAIIREQRAILAQGLRVRMTWSEHQPTAGAALPPRALTAEEEAEDRERTLDLLVQLMKDQCNMLVAIGRSQRPGRALTVDDLPEWAAVLVQTTEFRALLAAYNEPPSEPGPPNDDAVGPDGSDWATAADGHRFRL